MSAAIRVFKKLFELPKIPMYYLNDIKFKYEESTLLFTIFICRLPQYRDHGLHKSALNIEFKSERLKFSVGIFKNKYGL